MENKKNHISYKLEDVPPEVLEVWAIEMSGQPVGKTMWDKCQEVIKKYPEWFPAGPKEKSQTKNSPALHQNSLL